MFVPCLRIGSSIIYILLVGYGDITCGTSLGRVFQLIFLPVALVSLSSLIPDSINVRPLFSAPYLAGSMQILQDLKTEFIVTGKMHG